jgi:hypothetical protein
MKWEGFWKWLRTTLFYSIVSSNLVIKHQWDVIVWLWVMNWEVCGSNWGPFKGLFQIWLEWVWITVPSCSERWVSPTCLPAEPTCKVDLNFSCNLCCKPWNYYGNEITSLNLNADAGIYIVNEHHMGLNSSTI